MKPWTNHSRWDLPKQTWLTEEGKTGDCWRCCVAAVLGLPAETVPHFADGQVSFSAVLCNTQSWLSARGWVMIDVPPGEITFHGNGGDIITPPPVIQVGPTVRSRSAANKHAVVMIGDDVVYDPHPSEAGLLAVTQSQLLLPIHFRY